MNDRGRHALVFGASGFIGRHLVLALGREGVRVSVAVRSHDSYQRLVRWLAEHGRDEAPAELRADFASPSLITGEHGADVTEIYNCAGAYRFGMSADEARRANVDSVRAIVAFAARQPLLRRVVHVSGYRVGGGAAPADYRALGAYEASKVEADAVLRAEADRLGVPWSIVNPSSVIGDSATGESDQYLGLATTLKDLWQGALPAVPGNARTFVPIVAADYFAAFMTAVAADESAERAAYWVLDDDTPALPDLIALVAERYGVKAPRARIPVPVIERLPRWLTRADPETLTFLSSDRYPTEPARAFAARHALAMPDTATTIGRWADHLAAHRFGDAPAGERRFVTVGGVRTFELGQADAGTVVLPGLPVNADTWAPVVAALGDARAVDLPGLGMSAGRRGDRPAWLAGLVNGSGARHLVGHSIGAAAAVEAAVTHPEAVDRLTLVSPFFLQPRAGLVARLAPLTRLYLRRVGPEALAERLTGDAAYAGALRTSAADLRRRGVAATTGRLLAETADRRWRDALTAGLRDYPGRVHIIVGSDDPLTQRPPNAAVTVIQGAGHHPQLTHPREVAEAIRAHAGAPADPSADAPAVPVTGCG